MSTMDASAGKPSESERAMLMTTSSVASLRPSPTMAMYGLACVFLYLGTGSGLPAADVVGLR